MTGTRSRWRRLAIGTGAVAACVGVATAVARRRRDADPTSSLVASDRLQRTARIAGVGARAGGDFVALKARTLLADDERREQLHDEYQLRTAEQVANLLGGMKGALMKLGQMASYLDQGLPEPVREALAELQSDAPPMASELVREVVRAELGADPEVVFARWDPVPLAAASIGQVHVARTHDGRDVAVKVQYPGVDRAIAADLDNTDLLFQIMGVLFPGMDPKPIVTELRERIVEELDYRIEADHQRLFGEYYRGHPFIHVPEVFDEYSTARVLTTELADGVRFAEVLEWSDEERQLSAETLYRFAFGSIYGLRSFNGDPHPGNYLFRPGGHITFLDFGLCKRFSDDEVHTFERMIWAFVLERDVLAFQQVVTEIGILPPGLDVAPDVLAEYFGHFYEFVMEDRVMEITPEWSSRSVRSFFDLAGPHADIMKAANLPPSMVIIQRINLGLFALFGDLGARNNWRRIAEELWPFVDGSPSTPMGEAIAAWERARR